MGLKRDRALLSCCLEMFFENNLVYSPKMGLFYGQKGVHLVRFGLNRHRREYPCFCFFPARKEEQ